MTTAFQEAMTLTLGHEGGWYDGSDPRDPNPTMWGITQKTYSSYREKCGQFVQSVRFISLPERDEIYRQYWDGTCDRLPRLVALCVFDMSINAGPVVTRQIVQRSLDIADDGDLNGTVVDDGKFGPKTLAAIAATSQSPLLEKMLLLFVLLERVRFYDECAENARLRPNLKSWLGRTMAFYDKYVR